MSENLVRDIHDLVARSKNPAEASVRLSGTTRRELRAMQRDVLKKLRVRPGVSIAEIGCGIGLLGLALAEHGSDYLGLDFASQAVRVANERLHEAGVDNHARALCLDVLSATDEQFGELGRFDRVLLYAVLHFTRSENEGMCFLQRTLDLLAPGGQALVGNVPLEDLGVDWTPSKRAPRGVPARVIAAGRWIATPGSAPVPLTPRWKARHTLERMIKLNSRSSLGDFTPPSLPPNYALTLTTATVERWLDSLERNISYHWELPAPGVPLAARRADLILQQR